MPLKVYTIQMSSIRSNIEAGNFTVNQYMDITVKSGIPAFAPTWKMVQDHKAGKITDQEYTDMYYKMMRDSWRINNKEWKDLLAQDMIVLACFCDPNHFCHRHLLVDMLVKSGAVYCGELLYAGKNRPMQDQVTMESLRYGNKNAARILPSEVQSAFSPSFQFDDNVKLYNLGTISADLAGYNPDTIVIDDSLMQPLKIAFTGHRPKKLWGYNLKHPAYNELTNKIKAFLTAHCQHTGRSLHVYTGMALGFDTIVALASLELKDEGYEVFIEACTPCRDHSKMWPDEAKRQYKEILSKCDKVTLVNDKEYQPRLIQLRDEYMVNNAEIILALWDGSMSGTGNTVAYARSQNKKLFTLKPDEVYGGK